MDEMVGDFQLSTTLCGHEKDVRCLAALEGGGLVSGSRDFTARIWQPDESRQGYTESLVLKTHKNFVSCVCILPPDTQYHKGLILTGSNDRTIHAFDLGSTEPVFTLQGHTDTVSVLAAGRFGSFVSGSWDFSAKVWMREKCIMTLTGHEAAVWCVGIMDGVGYIVTGSADKSIRLWKGGVVERVVTGHTDCVRAIQVLSDNTFLSGSNDSTIRHWNLQGECLDTIQAHHSYIYTLAFVGGEFGEVVSGGEDGCVRVWREGSCVQAIRLPAMSVWSVCVLCNGDVAVATSDGLIRIFTRAPERTASPHELQAYKESVAQSSIPAQVGDIKTEDLPGPAALLTPGRTEGQVMMVRGTKAIEAYQWSSGGGGGEWVKVGEVTGGVSEKEEEKAKKKKIYKGKEYDYVFDVDIREGQPCLQLPYNLSDDPYTAAHHFLDENDISHSFLDQVANFILSQVPSATNKTPQVNDDDSYVDPYTGGTRYRGDNAEDVSKNTAAGMTYAHFPEKTPLKFEVVNVAKLMAKLREFNEVMEEGRRLSAGEVELVEEVLKGGVVEEVVEGSVDVIITSCLKLLKWTPEHLLPALDWFRICLLHPTFNHHLFTPHHHHQHLDIITYACTLLSTQHTHPKNTLLLLRCLSNCSVHPSGSSTILAGHQRLLERLSAVLPADNITQVALSSLLLNISIAFNKPPSSPSTTTTLPTTTSSPTSTPSTTTPSTSTTTDKSVIINFISSILPRITDSEAFFRLMVAMGTLLCEDKVATAIAISLDLTSKIANHPLHLSTTPSKLKTASTDVLRLIK